MKILGLIGGIAPESTIAYYRLLVAGFREREPEDYPRILINSINLTRLLSLVSAKDLSGLTDFLLAEVVRLADGGADVAGFASNTPHLVYDAVAARSPIPMVSIVEATGIKAQARGFTRVGLLGSRSTMESGFYPEVLGPRGITVVAPDSEDRDYVHRVYFAELVLGKFLPETKAGLLAVVERLRVQAGVQAVILGGTELPLILPDDAAQVPLLDTTAIHVEALLRRMALGSPA